MGCRQQESPTLLGYESLALMLPVRLGIELRERRREGHPMQGGVLSHGSCRRLPQSRVLHERGVAVCRLRRQTEGQQP